MDSAVNGARVAARPGPPPGGTPLAIDTAGLAKSFGRTQALAGVDLAVATGSVYGLLGPNGAGKTTTVRILATLVAPDRGRAAVLGHDVVAEAAAVRRRIAMTGQFTTVDDDLTGRENLVLLGWLSGLRRKAARGRAAELLAAFGLDKAAARQVKAYSGGMRRRLDLAASMIVRADLFFLDEPTTGLDPASRAQVWQLIRSIAASGATVLLTTQYLDEADELADRVAVIDRGAVVAEGTTSELKAAAGSGSLQVRLASPGRRPEAERMLADLLGVAVHAGADPAVLTARIPAAASPATPGPGGGGPGPAGERAAAALAALARAGIAVGEFSLGQPSLDEVFLTLTGHRAASPAHHQEDDS